MNVISRTGLFRLASAHPETLRFAAHWYKIVRKAEWRGLHQVREHFSSADQVGSVLIFNVLGGSFRLIAAVDYRTQRLFVKDLMTHREYERKEWMKWA